ncbi:MAG: hemerythrin domain-containing protein [Pseudomonadota bacterium]|nr:hemerythrin domain-containing protein [Pseudomonadota bacterium]
MTDIYKAIEEDHGKHRGLLGAIARTEGDSDERRRLWSLFYYDVKSHAAAEEETFYAHLMHDPDGQDDARHSVSEHKEMDDMLEELNGMDMSSPGWLARFKRLRENYEHHMEEEEQDIFSTARKLFDDAEAVRFAERFETRKAEERKRVDEKAEASLEE